MVYELNYRNGKLDKNSTHWYKNGEVENHFIGKKLSSGTMKDNKMHGKWTFWYHNGQKECEVICENGKLIDGTVWDDDGNVKESIRFNYKR